MVETETSTVKPIVIEPGSELDKLLEHVIEWPLLLERAGVRYRLEREDDDIWAGYDPERARASILAASGAWKGVIDAEAFKAYIRERRRTKNRPSVQL